MYYAKWHSSNEETGSIEDEGNVHFGDDQIKLFNEFLVKERQAFLLANPGHEAEENRWNKWMRDAWEDAEFKAECPNALGYYEEAYIDFVDLDNQLTN